MIYLSIFIQSSPSDVIIIVLFSLLEDKNIIFHLGHFLSFLGEEIYTLRAFQNVNWEFTLLLDCLQLKKQCLYAGDRLFCHVQLDITYVINKGGKMTHIP